RSRLLRLAVELPDPLRRQLLELGRDRLPRARRRTAGGLGGALLPSLRQFLRHGRGAQTFISAFTGTSPRRFLPFRNPSSITKEQPTGLPPIRRTSFSAASIVPPVASRSSTISTPCPSLVASTWISIVSVPYSSW